MLATLGMLLLPLGEASAEGRARPELGIGENSDAIFTDPLFASLGVRHVRVVVSYDVIEAATRGDDELERVARYLAGAAAGGHEPLVTFEHSRGDARACATDRTLRQCRLPTDAEYERSFRAFRARFPQVRAYAPWNEPNHNSQPTADRPEAAARLNDIAARVCPECTIVLADVLDQADDRLAARPTYRATRRWIARFKAALRTPRDVCGIHNHADVNRYRAAGTDVLLRALGCRTYWVTESGGIVVSRGLGYDPARQLRATRWLLELAARRPAITRLYVYTWFGAVTASWDSGLVTRLPDGTSEARPVYHLLARRLGAPPALAAPARDAALGPEIEAVADQALDFWAEHQRPDSVFPNPALAELAHGHAGFAPPTLLYALQRRGDPRSVSAAERAWPVVVSPANATAFDMVGAAYALRNLPQSPQTRERLASYLTAYPGRAPGRYNNLELVEALAVIATAAAGVPAPRLQQALRTVNVTVPRVTSRDGYLSDPGSHPLAYHVLSTLMLAEAVSLLGPRASPAARRTLRAMLDTLSSVVAPDGAADYLGRGQGNVWVPAATVAAMVAGAAFVPDRAARYLGVARLALARLRALHLTADRGLLVVPGVREGYDGIDPYVHTVAYNGLALWALTVAVERAAGLDAVAGPAPAEGRLRYTDRTGSGLAVVATGGTWMAVRALRRGGNSDLRSGFGLLALKVRDGLGWRDLLAPRPRVKAAPLTPAPTLGSHPPAGTGLSVRGGTIRIAGAYGSRRARFAFRARAGGADLEVAPVRRGDRLRLEVYAPAGSGRWSGRTLQAAGATWRFSAPIAVRRVPGLHSAPVERLDALRIDVRPRVAGRLSIRVSA